MHPVDTAGSISSGALAAVAGVALTMRPSVEGTVDFAMKATREPSSVAEKTNGSEPPPGTVTSPCAADQKLSVPCPKGERVAVQWAIVPREAMT